MQIQVFKFFTWPPDQTITCLSGLGPPTLSPYSAKFGGFRYCGKAVIRFFIFHVTMLWKAHMTYWVESFDCTLSLSQVWWPEVLQKYRYNFFEFVTWTHDQKVMWLWRWNSPTISYYSDNFGANRCCGREDIRL